MCKLPSCCLKICHRHFSKNLPCPNFAQIYLSIATICRGGHANHRNSNKIAVTPKTLRNQLFGFGLPFFYMGFGCCDLASGIWKRGRQKGVSLICSDNKLEQIGRIRSKSKQIGVFPKANRKKTRKSEQIGVTTFWRPQIGGSDCSDACGRSLRLRNCDCISQLHFVMANA